MRLITTSFAAALLALASSSASAATPKLEYYGGPVISNVVVYEVYWGPNIDATIKNQIDGFWKAIVASPYIDWLGEYDTVGLVSKSDGDAGTSQHIRRGSYGGAITITPANSNTILTPTDIRAELEAQIAAKNIPAPTLDAAGNVNTLYDVDFPKGVTLKDTLGNQSCSQFCSIMDDFPVGNAHVAAAYDPYIASDGPCSTGCYGAATTYGDALTRIKSGDLLNGVTDTLLVDGVSGANVQRPEAWYSNTGDQGTIVYNQTCSLKHGTIATYFLQAGWSNRLNNCVVDDPSLALCDGTKTPCRPCAPAGDSGTSDCSGAKADCETTPGNANQGLCVACSYDATCGAGKICDRKTDTCVTAPPDAGADSGSNSDASANDSGLGPDGGTGSGSGGCSCDASPDAGTFSAPLLFIAALFSLRRRIRLPKA